MFSHINGHLTSLKEILSLSLDYISQWVYNGVNSRRQVVGTYRQGVQLVIEVGLVRQLQFVKPLLILLQLLLSQLHLLIYLVGPGYGVPSEQALMCYEPYNKTRSLHLPDYCTYLALKSSMDRL